MSLNLMKHRMSVSGTTCREEKIKDGRRILELDFENDVQYNDNVVWYDTDDKIPIKMYEAQYSGIYGNITKFQTMVNDSLVEIGDLIHDTLKDAYWLCLENQVVSDIYNRGKLAQCSRFLKWQDADGVIHEIPIVIASASKYNAGISEYEAIQIPSDQVLIYTQLNDATVVLDRGMKFFIDENPIKPSVYEVTRVDTTLYSYFGKGMLTMIAVETTYTPNEEELEHGIIGYRYVEQSEEVEEEDTTTPPTTPPVTPPTPTIPTVATCSIDGRLDLKVTYPRTYTATFFDADENVIENAVFSWNVECEFLDKITQTINNNEISLQVDDESLIGEVINLSVIVRRQVLQQIEITITDIF